MSKIRLEKIMEEKGLGYLHITEFDNLESILENGLLSLDKVEELEISPKFISSDNSRRTDKVNKTSKYVRLCLYQQNDFIVQQTRHGVLKNPAIIMIKREIINISDEVRVTNMNAITNGAILYTKEEAENELDYDRIWIPRTWGNWSDQIFKDARQSEILVPHFISKDYFVRIYVQTGTDTSQLEKHGIDFEKIDVKSKITCIK